MFLHCQVLRRVESPIVTLTLLWCHWCRSLLGMTEGFGICYARGMPLFAESVLMCDVNCGTIQVTDLILKWLQAHSALPLDKDN